MAKRSLNWFSISRTDAEALSRLCPRDEFRVLPAKEFQLPPLPKALTDKYDHVVVAASGVRDSDLVYYMFNGGRVDERAGAIDQMPFGIALLGREPLPSGVLIQHADHDGRTTEPPQAFWDHLAASGIGDCYPLPGLPASKQGTLNDLSDGGQREAFGDLIREIRVQIVGKNGGEARE